MKRVSQLLRFGLVVPIVLLFCIGLSAQTDTTSGTTTAAKKKATKTTSAQKGNVHTLSGSGKVTSTSQAAAPALPNPADEKMTYSMVPVEAVAPVAEYSGSVLDLPQIPAHAMPELDLIEPADYVHNNLPIKGMMAPVGQPLGPIPSLLHNYSGMSYTDNYCSGGQCGAGHPPDTNGDVGLKHYIQSINMGYAIYDKATGNRLAAFTENALWAGAGTTPCTTSPYGDPIVVYDQVHDHWILSNLGFAFSGGNPVAPYMECVAVSKTGDPVNGGWYLYAFRIDQSPVPTNTLNDYPKMSAWIDGCLYMGANGFLNAGSFNGGIMAGFDLTAMYSGSAANFTLGYLSGTANFGYEPANLLGKATLPSSTSPVYFVTESSTSNAFNVRTLSNGACRAGGSISAATAVSHSTYNSVGATIIPQPGSYSLDSLGNRLMQRVQYRKIGGTESLWVNHTTRVSGSNTSPQWGQITVNNGSVTTPIAQQQIYRPDTTLYRWMGALAVDNGGDMALCYSTSNGTAPNYPSIACAGRLSTDAVSTLPQGETQVVTGAGSSAFLCGGANCTRWGDYSSMSVDPADDCTFWYTTMYYNSLANGTAGNHQTQIVAFKYPSCTAVVPVASITKTHTGSFTQGQTGATYTITVTNNGPGFMYGTTTVTDTLPSGLTATAIGGSGWSCTLGTLTCTSTSTVAAGSSFPAITLTVDVSSTAPASVTNSASVSGGGTGGSVTANDPTTIIQLTPQLAINKTHSGSFTQGQTGATYSIAVSNTGSGSTSGTVTVTDTLPSPYLAATAIGGTGWTCTLSSLSCTRTDVLGASSSYPAITLTVKVASNAPGQVTNSATVSGGNSSSATANDPTNINAAAPVCGTIQMTVAPTLAKLNNGSYQANVLLTNNGTGTAQNVKLTAATLGAANGTPIPQTIGNLVPGGFAYATVTFPASAGTSGSTVAEKLSGTYSACPTSGTFGASIRATLP